jgi:hypothetical protein
MDNIVVADDGGELGRDAETMKYDVAGGEGGFLATR